MTTQFNTPNVNIGSATPQNALESPPIDNVNRELIAREIVARLLPEYQALSVNDLLPINVDIPTAVATALGALPEIRLLRAEVASKMPSYDLVVYDKVEEAAIGLNDLHAEYLIATEPSDELKALLAEAGKLRETLLADATALAHRGLIDSEQLGELRGPVGHKNLATDLNLLCKVLGAKFPQIAGKCATTEAELSRAGKLQQRIMRLVGEKEQGGTQSVATVTEMRQRAFTYFVRTYDHVRRAVSFLRWQEGDIETITPSLYAGRNKRKASDVAAVNAQPPGSIDMPPAEPTGPHAGGSPGVSGTGGSSNASGSANASAASDPFLT
jgi:hypothetical protein